MSIGDNIKRERKKVRVKQSELAEELQTDISTISRWENNKNLPNAETITKIAHKLNIPVSALYDEPPQQQEATQTETLGLAYWGEVADNIRKLMNSGDDKKISLIRPLLVDSLEIDNEHEIKTPITNNIKMQNNYGHHMIAKIEGGN